MSFTVQQKNQRQQKLLLFFLLLNLFVTIACGYQNASQIQNPSSPLLSPPPSFPGLADQLHDLPGLNLTSLPQGRLPFRQYAGYLHSINSSHLYYWFFEALQSNDTPTSTRPLVIWLNGGPGVSSLTGALLETGPLAMQADGTLALNPYAWNGHANLLFIDTPIGVGFSTSGLNTSSITTNDQQTAELNYAALSSFYGKFPHLQDNALFLAGQSYAGVYLPTLAMLILERRFPPNLKGISLGNPLLDHRYVVHSPIQLAHDHGLINQSQWEWLLEECNCSSKLNSTSGLNSNQTFPLKKTPPKDAVLGCPFLPFTGSSSALPDLQPPACDTAYYQIYHFLYKLAHNAYNYKQNCTTREDTFICRTDRDEAASAWLNRPDVQRALRAERGSEPGPQNAPLRWKPFTEDVREKYRQSVRSVERHFRFLLGRGVRILLYFGELDLTCTYISGQWFLADLALNKTAISTLPLNLNESKKEAEYTVEKYDGGQLTFIRLKEAGHRAVRDKPALLQTLFDDFLNFTIAP